MIRKQLQNLENCRKCLESKESYIITLPMDFDNVIDTVYVWVGYGRFLSN